MASCNRGSEDVASLIVWKVTDNSLTVAVSIEEISDSKKTDATTELSGIFWCMLMSLNKASACRID